MDAKLLFVDDDRSLLNGIERILGFDYRLETAESGQEGLAAIRCRGPYVVIFTDMRMPNMDGLKFVEEARQIAPDSIYVMLTGNNDQETAVNAINKGRVFRFLNKPCEEQELVEVIADCTRQYELVRAEKDLLQQTFVGAVRVLTDVIDAIQPQLAGRGERLQEHISALCRAAGIDQRWEFRLAGRLSTLGVALLPEASRLRLERTECLSEFAVQTQGRADGTVGRLLREIPRLDVVAQICEKRAHSTGKICNRQPKTPAEIVSVGVALLEAAYLWDDLARRGLAAEEVRTQLGESLPDLPEEMIAEVVRSRLDSAPIETVVVPVHALEEGMVAGADIMTLEGGVLLRRGRRLSQVAVEKLWGYEALRPIEITATSAGVVL